MSGGCRVGRSFPSPYAHHGAPGKSMSTVARTGGGSSGTMSNWSPRRVAWREEGRQREKIADRSNDLAANNAHAASLIDSMTVNTVGTGLWPQSTPNWKRLGITEAQALELAETAEWEFEQFARTSDATAASAETATCNFFGQQFQNIWSMLVNGEFVNLPLMLDDPGRRYSLALQTVDPARLRTPSALSGSRDIRDGIRLGDRGQVLGYFLADPDDGLLSPGLDFRQFRELPPRMGHRPVVLHRFHKKEPEQVRGMGILAPGMKYFRDLGDYFDFALVGQIVAASFPVWIKKMQGNPYNPEDGGQQDPATKRYYQEIAAGQLYYGNDGEEPVKLGGEPPGNSFQVFTETVLRGLGACAGMPYEVIAKDFSKTNYSSARAALAEAYRVFNLYQDWLVNSYCQVVWEMFWEEAWLRGRIKLPKGAPDFYSARAEYCAANWIVPEQTVLDPVKEMVSAVMGLNANATTLADVNAKRGKDWEATMEQRARERKKAVALELNPDPPSVKEAKNPAGEESQ